MSVLELRSISKVYGRGAAEVQALRDISLSVPAMVSRVDLPDPLGPITATIMPAGTDMLMSRSACTSAAPFP